MGNLIGKGTKESISIFSGIDKGAIVHCSYNRNIAYQAIYYISKLFSKIMLWGFAWISISGFEAGGQNVPSNIDPWFIIGDDSSIIVSTDRSSCFERNKIALRMEVLCDSQGSNVCPTRGVGVYNPGFWGMVRMNWHLLYKNIIFVFYVSYISYEWNKIIFIVSSSVNIIFCQLNSSCSGNMHS